MRPMRTVIAVASFGLRASTRAGRPRIVSTLEAPAGMSRTTPGAAAARSISSTSERRPKGGTSTCGRFSASSFARLIAATFSAARRAASAFSAWTAVQPFGE